MKVKLLLLASMLLAPVLGWAAGTSTSAVATATPPPPPMREFRAAWVATVGNSSWPSKPGLSTAQQKAELLAILDRSAALKLNCIVFQVRPACDALYQSSLEPWSEYLTGVQGRAPAPFYDPLAFAITEAHKRGLELHAWFNPFRARHYQSTSPAAAGHVSRTRPELVRSYAKYLWLDPGDPAVRDYSIRVVLDVLKRYDVDGIHMDDYFYPYHEKNAAGADIDFPDAATWKQYGVKSGLSRDDWRRHNVDVFMEQLYRGVKAVKPWVSVGVSPFGIWRPKNPPTISGFDAYTEIYCDSRKWLQEGWCDYLAPQLYWGIQPPPTSFSTLLDWWNNQNPRHRHIWPGINSLKAAEKWQPSEIVNQINITHRYPNPGHIHWSVNALMRNAALDAALARDVYRSPALIPASPWLGSTPPPTPKLSVSSWGQSAHVEWKNSGTNNVVRLWVLQSLTAGSWTTQIIPGTRLDTYLDSNKLPEAIALRAVDRTGNLSEFAFWIPKKYSSAEMTKGMKKPAK